MLEVFCMFCMCICVFVFVRVLLILGVGFKTLSHSVKLSESKEAILNCFKFTLLSTILKVRTTSVLSWNDTNFTGSILWLFYAFIREATVDRWQAIHTMTCIKLDLSQARHKPGACNSWSAP